MVKPRQENLGDHIRRVSRYGRRPPVRSLRELADDIGISAQHLSVILSVSPDAPQPRLRTRGWVAGRNTWFEPREFIAWWNARQKPTKP